MTTTLSGVVISPVNMEERKTLGIKAGDTVRVHQKIQDKGKTRIQIFEGLVIRTDRKDSLTSAITVRRIASGVGVEKSFLLHSPLVEEVEVVKRSKVRRKYLSYMRNRSGKSARLASVDFDKKAVNDIKEDKPVVEATAKVTEAASVEEVKSE